MADFAVRLTGSHTLTGAAGNDTLDGGDGNDWDYDDATRDFDGYVENYVVPQVRELMTGYGPICLIWYDTPKRMTAAQSKRLTDLVHELQPDCLVNGRVGNNMGDYAEAGDNVIPDETHDMDFETPATITAVSELLIQA